MIGSGNAATDYSERNLAICREIISNTCQMLRQGRRITSGGPWQILGASADCYVLLQDATKLFCHCVSQHHKETTGRRWSPVLPELLLSHPEKCRETLAMVEQKDFQPLTYFQFVAA